MSKESLTTTSSHDSDSRDNPIKSSMEDNLKLVQKVRSRQGGKWMSKLLPNAQRRIGNSAEVKELEVGFDFRHRALKLAIESKLQAVQEACNHVLVTGKSEIRRERQEFFADQVSRLAMSMHHCAEEFNTEIDRRLDEINIRYKSDIIRRKEEERLVRQIEGFHQVLDDMANEFQQIINEGVHTDKPLLSEYNKKR